MFLNVDLIGPDAVANTLKQTELKRFIIYRQGANLGSTPVYDCSHTQTNMAAVKCFKDWAANILMYNPQNFICYEILAFDDYETEDNQPKPANFKPKGQQGKKTGKMRVSFALTGGVQNFNNNQGQQFHAPQIDISGEIQKGIDLAMLRHELKIAKETIAEYENDDDDDETEGDDIITKVTSMMKAINGETMDAAHISGDENLTAQKNIHNLTPAELSIKNKNIQKAVNILFRHNKNLDIDLLKLANMAETNKIVFNVVIEKLRSF